MVDIYDKDSTSHFKISSVMIQYHIIDKNLLIFWFIWQFNGLLDSAQYSGLVISRENNRSPPGEPFTKQKVLHIDNCIHIHEHIVKQ